MHESRRAGLRIQTSNALWRYLAIIPDYRQFFSDICLVRSVRQAGHNASGVILVIKAISLAAFICCSRRAQHSAHLGQGGSYNLPKLSLTENIWDDVCTEDTAN